MESQQDPTVQQQSEEFRRQLQAMAAQHQQAIKVMAAYGLLRDLGVLHDPPPSHPSLLGELATWLRRRLLAALSAHEHRRQRPKVVIIEPDGREYVPSGDPDTQHSTSRR